MMTLDVYLMTFLQAWNMLLDIPFPNALLNRFVSPDAYNDDVDTLPPSLILYSFPVVGIVLGLIVMIPIWLLAQFADSAAVAVLSAFAVVIFLEYTSKGKNITAIVSFVESTSNHQFDGRAFNSPQSSIGQLHSNLGLMILSSLFLLRVCSVGMLVFYHRISWIPVVLIMNYTVQAQLAIQDDLDGEPFFEVQDPEKTTYHWIIGVIASLVIGVFYLPFVLIAIFVAYLFAGQYNQLCQKRIGGINGTLIGMGGYIIETLLLIAGLVFLVRT